MRLPVQSAGLNGRRLGKRVMLSGGIQPALTWDNIFEIVELPLVDWGIELGEAIGDALPPSGGRLGPPGSYIPPPVM